MKDRQTYTSDGGGYPSPQHTRRKANSASAPYFRNRGNNTFKRQQTRTRTPYSVAMSNAMKEVINRTSRKADDGKYEKDPTQGWGTRMNAEVVYNRFPRIPSQSMGNRIEQTGENTGKMLINRVRSSYRPDVRTQYRQVSPEIDSKRTRSYWANSNGQSGVKRTPVRRKGRWQEE